jgi:hypothetical protein
MVIPPLIRAAPFQRLRLYLDSSNSSVPSFDPCRKRGMQQVCGPVTFLQIVIQTAKFAISIGEMRQPI